MPTIVDDEMIETTAVVIDPPTRITSYALIVDAVAAVNVKEVAAPLIATPHDDVATAALHEDEATLMTAEDASPTTLMQCAAVDVIVELVETMVSVDVVPNSIPVVDVVKLDDITETMMLLDVADADGDSTSPVPLAHDTVDEPTTTVS